MSRCSTKSKVRRPRAAVPRAWVLSAALVSLPFVLYSTGYAMLESPMFVLRDVTVQGADRVETATILAAAGLDRPRNVIALDEAEMERAIEALPWVGDASVRIRPDRSVRIRVREAEMVAVAVTDRARAVDETGRTIADWNEPLPQDALLVVPRITPGTSDRAIERQIAEGVGAARRIAEVAGIGPLREIHGDGPEHYRMVTVEGAEVRIAMDDLETRVSRVDEVLRWGRDRGLVPVHVLADGRHLDRVTVRWTQGAARVADVRGARHAGGSHGASE